jgi:hypothetical protein
MVRLAFVSHNNKGRQRTYIAGSHYLDMIIINAHLHSHSEQLIITLYVDDLLLFSRITGETKLPKEALSSAFEMQDLGEAKYVLGIDVIRNRTEKTLVIDQEYC